MGVEFPRLQPGDRVLLGLNYSEETFWDETQKSLTASFPDVEFVPVFDARPVSEVLWVYRDDDHPYVTPQTTVIGLMQR